MPPQSHARGALLDTLANIATIQGDLLTAQSAISEIEEVIAALSGSSLMLVDSAPVRATLLKDQGRLVEADNVLSIARDAASARGDIHNWAKLTLLRSEVRTSLVDANAASIDIIEVLKAVDHPSADVLGLLARARAVRASGEGDLRRASAEFARASRVFAKSGDKFLWMQTQEMRKKSLPERVARNPLSPRKTRVQLELTEGLAFVCGLLPQPHLAGTEAVRLLKRMQIVESAEVLHAGADASRAGDDLMLGNVSAETFVLKAVPSDTAHARETFAHVANVIRIAAEAVRAHAESTRQILSWEIDIAPEGAIGLYVSAPMKRLLATIRRIAATEVPVLIAGETGTGKEIVAKEIHALSARAHGPFVPLNVTAVPREMLEGQLFGYRRGAFTGAVSDARGLIREAEGGTLFIDEIGDLSPDLQPKLLRFLESGEIQPLGERPQRVDVRIVAATNARLDHLVKEGRFRDDLFYRLNVVALTIPPLRDRREEIPTLINHFLTQHARDAGKLIPQLSPHALERLSAYDWPGNVRQLTNELKRIVALHDENALIEVEHLSEAIRQPAAAPPASTTVPADAALVSVRLDQTLQAMYDDVERAAIPRALRLSRNNQSETAQRLGITRKGLYLKRRRLGLGEESG